MKLAGEGDTPNWLMNWGELKSSISSLNRIPLTRERILEPKLKIGPDQITIDIQPSHFPPGAHPHQAKSTP